MTSAERATDRMLAVIGALRGALELGADASDDEVVAEAAAVLGLVEAPAPAEDLAAHRRATRDRDAEERHRHRHLAETALRAAGQWPR